MKIKILVYDNDREHNNILNKICGDDISITFSDNSIEFYNLLTKKNYDIALISDRIYDISIQEIKNIINAKNIKTELLYISEKLNINDMILKIKSGAYYYFLKPVDLKLFNKIIIQIKKTQKNNEKKNKSDKKDIFDRYEIIGESRIIKNIRHRLKECDDNDLNVLITGPTGSGKDLAAYNIYKTSKIFNNKYIKIDCSLLPLNLIDNELFGHYKGAYTGAYYNQKGLFETGNNGTIYIDGLDNISYEIQAKFLNVLENKSFYKIGAEEPTKIKTRFIISSLDSYNTNNSFNINFRDDLFYRVKCITIKMPYLQEHIEDIKFLVDYFNDYYAVNHNRNKLKFTKQSINILENHKWIGNVRELENLIQKLVVLGKSDNETIRNELNKNNTKVKYEYIKPGLSLEDVEKMLIINTYEYTGNSIKVSAQLLGITTKTLSNKLKKILK